MRWIGGVICDPDVLERLGIDEEGGADLPLPLPPKMASPSDDTWPPPCGDDEYEYVDEGLLRERHRPQIASVVTPAKLRG